MGKLKAIGAAQSKPQIDTIAIGGTWADTETVTIQVAEKEVTYTCGSGETTSTVASGLQALAAASTDPEFEEITWTVDTADITATSTTGIPVTITGSEASASGTIGVSNVQAATGPYHWDNVDNWDTGAVPTGSDEVFIEDQQIAFRYGLPTSLTLNRLVITAGEVGLPDRNPAGYAEYRTKRAVISCTDVVIGEVGKRGVALVRLDFSTSVAIVSVFSSRSRPNDYAVDLKLNSASATVHVLSGQVGIASEGEDTSTVGTVVVGASGNVMIGEGATVTTVTSAGTLILEAAATTLNVKGGTTALSMTGAIGTLAMTGGVFFYNGTGTITTATVRNATLECAQDLRAKTITDLELDVNGRFNDPNEVITVTNGITLASGTSSVQAV